MSVLKALILDRDQSVDSSPNKRVQCMIGIPSRICELEKKALSCESRLELLGVR